VAPVNDSPHWDDNPHNLKGNSEAYYLQGRKADDEKSKPRPCPSLHGIPRILRWLPHRKSVPYFVKKEPGRIKIRKTGKL
jgi:hypothetical protein